VNYTADVVAANASFRCQQLFQQGDQKNATVSSRPHPAMTESTPDIGDRQRLDWSWNLQEWGTNKSMRNMIGSQAGFDDSID
jgi:hypothetical protein